MNLSDTHIILGSGSPRRRQLLQELGWQFEVRIKETPETMPPNLNRGEMAIHLAEMKAKEFDGTLNEQDLLITADTIVCKEEDILNKPADETEAVQMLTTLSGHKHEVYTGVCLSTSKRRISFSVESSVYFKKISKEEIINYIREFKPFDKAGSYGAQECLDKDYNPCSDAEIKFIAKIEIPTFFEKSLHDTIFQNKPLIEKIEGGYFNVMGLPVVELWENVSKILSKKD